jgi:hypothetical protein
MSKKQIKKIFIEYGLDFDNNKFGFGRSFEIEYSDGTEKRTSEKIHIDKITSRYLRIWIGKFVVVLTFDSPHISLNKKNRWNFKIVYGISGY